MQKTIMFTHNDLDGVGCGILHKAGFGLFAETHYCGYHNVDEKITKVIRDLEAQSSERPMIIISDLGIKPETAKLVERYEGEKVLLDHHATNHWIEEEYRWATINEDASGTLLVFNHFEDEIPRKYLDFALHVDDYDRWVHNYPSSKELNRLYFIVGIERFETRFLSNEKIQFNETEEMLLVLEDEAVELYTDKVERGVQVYEMAGDKRFGVAYADRYQSEAAHNLIDRLELDAIGLIDANGRKISLRSKPNFDIGSIAGRLGGGGHKNAAGVGFNYGKVEDFHGSKYPLYELYQDFENIMYSLFWKVNKTFEENETREVAKMFERAVK